MAQRRRQPEPYALQSITLPAPTGGVNAVDPASAMPVTDCLWAYNLIASEYGLRTRLGYREYFTGLTGALANDVRQILTFKGAAASGSGDRVFALTSTGIWDVTTSREAWVASTAYVIGDIVVADGKYYTCDTNGTSAASPATGPSGSGANIADGTTQWDYTGLVRVLDFAITSGDAGYGIAHTFVNSAGAHFLLYCDEANGYHVYTSSTDAWAAISMGGGGTQISGVDPTTFRYVHIFKNRVCFTAADSQTMYYLAAGTLYGAATAFPLGAQFKSGGDLVGLWSWTFDGGAGIDDALVAISRGGDVAVYLGSDVSSANTFAIKGIWRVGGVPAGREIAHSVGGDLWILTRNGIRSAAELIAGFPDSTKWPTAKIANTFNQLMLTRATLKRWKMRIHPEENALILMVPEADNSADATQWAMSLANRSWTPYRDLPIYSAEVHAGKFYFGTTDGRVCIHDGTIDAVTLADTSVYSQIEWSLLTSYQSLGSPNVKQVQMVRPELLSQTASPTVETTVKYDYDLIEPATPSVVASSSSGVWDSGLWDTAIWGGDYNAETSVRGAVGMGRKVAIAIRGNARSRTTLVGIDVHFTVGGIL